MSGTMGWGSRAWHLWLRTAVDGEKGSGIEERRGEERGEERRWDDGEGDSVEVEATSPVVRI